MREIAEREKRGERDCRERREKQPREGESKRGERNSNKILIIATNCNSFNLELVYCKYLSHVCLIT